MPNKCCVIGCKGNYDSSKEKTHSFKFPKDETLRNKWVQAISRKDYIPGKWSSVCGKHFDESDIIKTVSTAIDQKTGNKKFFPAKVRLKEGAVPRFHLNNSNVENEDCVNDSIEISTPRTSPRKTQPKRYLTPESSSDDDLPLEKLRNQLNSSETKNSNSPGKKTLDNADIEIFDDSNENKKVTSKKFKKLLEEYENLKKRSLGLDQEIKVLEKVNIELKCEIFK